MYSVGLGDVGANLFSLGGFLLCIVPFYVGLFGDQLVTNCLFGDNTVEGVVHRIFVCLKVF